MTYLRDCAPVRSQRRRDFLRSGQQLRSESQPKSQGKPREIKEIKGTKESMIWKDERKSARNEGRHEGREVRHIPKARVTD